MHTATCMDYGKHKLKQALSAGYIRQKKTPSSTFTSCLGVFYSSLQYTDFLRYINLMNQPYV